MPYNIKVIVQRNGRPISGARVTVEAEGLTAGMSSPATTNSSGQAICVVHSSRRGTVYVNGTRYGSVNAAQDNLINL